MRIIEGLIRRTNSNRLAMKFHDIDLPDLAAPRHFTELGDVGEASQSGDEGKGKTLQILLGWRDGGPGRHTLTLADGRQVIVATTAKEGTAVEDADGTVLARMTADQPMAVCGPDGRPMFSFTGPDELTGVVYEMAVLDAAGGQVGRLQVCYDDHAWRQISVARDVARAAVSLGEEIRTLTGSGGSSLKVKIAGTRLFLDATPTEPELTVLLAVCVDIAIGYRRYLAGMRKV